MIFRERKYLKNSFLNMPIMSLIGDSINNFRIDYNLPINPDLSNNVESDIAESESDLESYNGDADVSSLESYNGDDGVSSLESYNGEDDRDISLSLEDLRIELSPVNNLENEVDLEVILAPGDNMVENLLDRFNEVADNEVIDGEINNINNNENINNDLLVPEIQPQAIDAIEAGEPINILVPEIQQQAIEVIEAALPMNILDIAMVPELVEVGIPVFGTGAGMLLVPEIGGIIGELYTVVPTIIEHKINLIKNIPRSDDLNIFESVNLLKIIPQTIGHIDINYFNFIIPIFEQTGTNFQFINCSIKDIAGLWSNTVSLHHINYPIGSQGIVTYEIYNNILSYIYESVPEIFKELPGTKKSTALELIADYFQHDIRLIGDINYLNIIFHKESFNLLINDNLWTCVHREIIPSDIILWATMYEKTYIYITLVKIVTSEINILYYCQ